MFDPPESLGHVPFLCWNSLQICSSSVPRIPVAFLSGTIFGTHSLPVLWASLQMYPSSVKKSQRFWEWEVIISGVAKVFVNYFSKIFLAVNNRIASLHFDGHWQQNCKCLSVFWILTKIAWQCPFNGSVFLTVLSKMSIFMFTPFLSELQRFCAYLAGVLVI